MIDLHKPIAWIGNDRLVLDDVTRHGLHRLVIARNGKAPDFVIYYEMAVKQARGAEIMYFESQRGEFFLLWFLWKEKGNGY